jgi:hypothetical protein
VEKAQHGHDAINDGDKHFGIRTTRRILLESLRVVRKAQPGSDPGHR